MIQGMYYLGEMITMAAMGEWTYHWSTKDKKRWFISVILYAICLINSMMLYETTVLHFIIFYIGKMFAWWLLCSGEWKKRAVRIFVLSYVVGIMESLIGVLVSTFWGQYLMLEMIKLVDISLTFMFCWVVTRQIWYAKLINYLAELSGVKKLLITCVLITGVAVLSFGTVLQERVENRDAILVFQIVCASLLFLIIVILVWFVIENYQRKYLTEQNYLKEEYIRMQQDYYAAIYEKDNELRRFRHDVANHLGVLKILLERGEYEAATSLLQSISQEFSQASFEKIQVGDELLNAILSMMNQKAAEQGVGLHVAGELQRQGKYDVYSLCTIFSNAISNGIEACTHLQQDKVVDVKMVSHNGTLCCIFENPATEAMYQATLRGETSKADKKNHGHGVWNIKKAVEQLGGNMEYQFADGKIKLEVYI